MAPTFSAFPFPRHLFRKFVLENDGEPPRTISSRGSGQIQGILAWHVSSRMLSTSLCVIVSAVALLYTATDEASPDSLRDIDCCLLLLSPCCLPLAALAYTTATSGSQCTTSWTAHGMDTFCLGADLA